MKAAGVGCGWLDRFAIIIWFFFSGLGSAQEILLADLQGAHKASQHAEVQP